MKPTPMMALPVATLMMLLSSTFVRLPGTVATELGHPRTDMSPTNSLNRDGTELFDKNPKTSKSISTNSRRALSSGDIHWTALSLDLLDHSYKNIKYPDTVRLSPASNSRDYFTANELMIAKEQNGVRLTTNDKRMRSKHLARR